MLVGKDRFRCDSVRAVTGILIFIVLSLDLVIKQYGCVADTFLCFMKSVTPISGSFHVITTGVGDRKPMKFVAVAVDSFNVVVITDVSDKKSMRFTAVAVDFFLVVVTTKVSDRKSMNFVAVVMDSFHVVTAEMGD